MSDNFQCIKCERWLDDLDVALNPTDESLCRICIMHRYQKDREELENLKWFLEREGYRRCDIRACNCGSYHGGHTSRRLEEIDEMLDEFLPDTNGMIILEKLKALTKDRELLKEILQRCEDTACDYDSCLLVEELKAELKQHLGEK